MAGPFSDNLLDHRSYFFDSGIRFTCQQCGACCVGVPGTIYISAEEIRTVSRFMDMNASEFKRQNCYAFKDAYSIREDTQGRCLFFKDGCGIYPVRPLQCRTFPFWFSNMRSEKRWRRVEKQCPGIGTGLFYSREEILSIAQRTIHF